MLLFSSKYEKDLNSLYNQQQNMVLDHLGRPIENTIDDTIFSKASDRKEFYHNYIIGLDQTIGLPRLDFSQFQFNNWIELFNRIQKEFKKHSPLNKVMSYADFFNAFFVKPYGLKYSSNESNHFFIDTTDSLESKERNVVEFHRKINIPLLLNQSIEMHQRKFESLQESNELFEKDKINIIYDNGEEELEGLLKAEFSNNYWKNILSNSEDCIFISHHQDQVIFREYWLASMLHQYHPEINYLGFNVEKGKELKKMFPYPLTKAKLMRTSDPNIPLIVGGVLGEDLRKIKLKSSRFTSMEDFINYSIWQHFSLEFEKKVLFYNLSDSMQLERPAHQFDEYIKKYYFGKKTNAKEKIFFSVPNLESCVNNIAASKDSYLGEQFSETFAFPNKPKKKEKRVGSFVPLKGKVWGVSARSYDLEAKKFPKGTLTGVAMFFGGIALASMFYLGTLDKPDPVIPTTQQLNEMFKSQKNRAVDSVTDLTLPISKEEDRNYGLTKKIFDNLRTYRAIASDKIKNVVEYQSFLHEQKELCKGSELLALSRVAEEFNRKLFAVVNDCAEVHDNISCCKEVGCIKRDGMTFVDWKIDLNEFIVAKYYAGWDSPLVNKDSKQETVLVINETRTKYLSYDSYDDAELAVKSLNALAKSFKLRQELSVELEDFNYETCPSNLFRNEKERIALETIANTINKSVNNLNYSIRKTSESFLKKAMVYNDKLYLIFNNQEQIRSYEHPKRPQSVQLIEIKEFDLTNIIDFTYRSHMGSDFGPRHAWTNDSYSLVVELNGGTGYRFHGYDYDTINNLSKAFRDLVEIYTGNQINLLTD